MNTPMTNDLHLILDPDDELAKVIRAAEIREERRWLRSHKQPLPRRLWDASCLRGDHFFLAALGMAAWCPGCQQTEREIDNAEEDPASSALCAAETPAESQAGNPMGVTLPGREQALSRGEA